jgi:hypothetical protein
MFTLDESSHTFWFNPDSLESAMEFRLIGIVRPLSTHPPPVLTRRSCWGWRSTTG